ncbi:MAG: four helix bundle protein [Gemmatimonadota bacterium]|nr:four helix bundle protein [Gemmatimonadota bacterium]HEU4989211.1 four helix bundle protein [Gemmatimonadaceae bacterium]
MAGSLKDLKVWQEAVGLAADVIRAVRHTSRREVKAVSDGLMLSAIALADQIAEGFGRYSAPEQRQCYRAARRALLRLETELAVARQADLVSAAHLTHLSHRAQLVGRLLGGYLVYLDRQVAEPAAATRDSARAPG